MTQAATAEKEKAAEKKDAKTNVQSAEFPEAADANVKGSGGSIDILLDMNVPITVTIGQTSIPVRRLLQLAPGSVIKLDKSLEEPVELYLNGSKFATGSVVVVDGCFAVKIKQIVGIEDSPEKNN
jgi:flagellar motor switch protein FliN/FliY